MGKTWKAKCILRQIESHMPTRLIRVLARKTQWRSQSSKIKVSTHIVLELDKLIIQLIWENKNSHNTLWKKKNGEGQPNRILAHVIKPLQLGVWYCVKTEIDLGTYGYLVNDGGISN